MNTFSRADRVGGMIQQTLSEVLLKEIRDPGLTMVTISEVKMSADLRLAKVYFTVPDADKSKEKAIKGFKRSSGYIKRTLAPLLGLRYMPDLRYYYDDTFDRGQHIEALFRKINSDQHD